jgi:hypothetical protein
VLGAPASTVHKIPPTAAPLFVTPRPYWLDKPIPAAVLRKKLLPDVLIVKK